MDNLIRGIRVLHQNAIRIEADGRVLYFDPYGVQDAPHDADYIFVTHDHYDHFSPGDIGRVSKADTTLVVPESARAAAEAVGLAVLSVQVGQSAALPGVSFRTVPAYNLNKKFHPRAKDWVGYVAELGGGIYYIAGDTDATPEARAVRCDVALLPIGGTYTMDAEEAAGSGPRHPPPGGRPHPLQPRCGRPAVPAAAGGGSPLSNSTGKPVTESFH